jgi:hypothetical protein
MTGDEVRLIAADPVHTPGHAAWLKSQPMPHVRGGFSLGTDRGEVTTFFRMSELNPPPGFLLSAALTREVLGLLPTRPDIKVHTD